MKKRLWSITFLVFIMFGILTTFAESADVPRMTVDDLKAMLGNPGLVIVDVRLGRDWADNDIKIQGAVREDPESVKTWAEKYSKDKTFVLYCA